MGDSVAIFKTLPVLLARITNTFNIVFHAPMGRLQLELIYYFISCFMHRWEFQLELIYYFTYFSTVVPSNICVYFSCRPFVVNTTFSAGLVGVEVCSVSWLGQLTAILSY